MSHLFQRRSDEEPRIPVYADARVGGFTLTFRMKALIGAFLLVVALITAFVFQRAQLADQRHRDGAAAIARGDAAIRELRALTARIDAIAAANQAAVRELACIIVAQVPNDPKKPIIEQFRRKYDCPAYDPKRPPLLVPPESSSPTAQGPPPGSGGSIPLRASPGSSPTATGPARSTSAPRPSPTPAPAPSTTRTCVLIVCLPTGLPLPPPPLGIPRPF